MKSFKAGRPIAAWLLRIALMPLLFQLYYIPVSTLNLGSIAFYLGISMLVSGFLIIIGGLFSKPGLTIISGIIIVCISVYKIILSFNGNFDSHITMSFVTTSIGLFFFTNGNES